MASSIRVWTIWDSARGDHLAADEDLALAVARGDAQVGLAGLARAVDHAAHDRDPQRDLHTLEPAVTSSASLYTSTWARPQDGQDTISRRRWRRPSDSRIEMPTLTSSTGGADSETLIVSPMPSASSAPTRPRT